MLVMSRKKDEWIRVSDCLRFKVSKVQGGRVQLCFEDLNGHHLKIMREELLDDKDCPPVD